MQQLSGFRLLQRASRNVRRFSTSDLPRKPRESHYRSLCKLTLIGRTGAEPEVREFDSGNSLSLRVATNLSNGETQWHSVLVSEQVPGFSFFRELPTGSLVYVEGSMRINNFVRDDGTEKTYVNVSVYPGMGMFRVLGYPRRVEQADDLPF